MKQVIGKIFILFLIVFAINQVLHKALIPYDWGDKVLHQKNNYYQSKVSNYNAVFVGGSLFYRHIDATTFDSINTANGLPTRSFNYGVDGNNHIKQMILMDRLLDQKDTPLEYIFFALSSDAYFEKRNLHTKKFVTWVDFKSMRYAVNVGMDSDTTLNKRLTVSYQYVLTWLENKLNAGMGMYLVNMLNDKRKPAPKVESLTEELGRHLDGFSPYHFDTDVDSASLSYGDQLLYWSNNHFKRNLDVMDSINQTYINDYETYVIGEGHINQTMLKQYNALIEKAKSKGIQLIVMLPPRSRLSYHVFLPLYDALPEGHKMNMSDIQKYPEFYSYDNTFNFYHMNERGAGFYTEAVTQAFLKLNGMNVDFYEGDSTLDVSQVLGIR